MPILSSQPLLTPAKLKNKYPSNTEMQLQIQSFRETIQKIIFGEDSRLIVITGPCSIHDTKAAIEYAKLIKQIAKQYRDELFIVMRVYFEKPRTLIGWKGLISDPFLNGSFKINEGLANARELLLQIAEMKVPAATEFLDSIIPQYLEDLISWTAIGARTSESQIHREIASGLSMPIGFKNNTDGNFNIAIDAVLAASHPHHYISISNLGEPCFYQTSGNAFCHIVLRGSQNAPNYFEKDIQQVALQLKRKNIHPAIIVDCSHGNSMKNYLHQKIVANDLSKQIAQGSNTIKGVMIESNLIEGQQALVPNKNLVFGQSITDACISWEETLSIFQTLAKAVRSRNSCRSESRSSSTRTC